MSVTTTAGTPPPTNAGNGYGDLDQPHRPAGGNRPLLWIAAAIALAAAGVVAFLVLSGDGDPEPEAAPTNTTTTRSTSTTVEETTSTTATAPPVSIEINGWQLTNDDEGLPDYATAPIIYDEDTIEGDIELGFANSEIATIRSAANPTVEEPELRYWKTGFTLRAALQVKEILAEDGQVLLPGAASRLEIEDITVRSDTEADVEFCYLIHDYSVVVDNPDDRIESLGTVHAINRMVLGPDGQWQNSEQVSIIQDIDGFGACLDLDLVPADS